MKFQSCCVRVLIMGLAMLSIGLLSGCGEVVVFGHTIREGKHPSEAESKPDEAPDSQSPQSVTPADSAKPSAASRPQSYEQQQTKPATVAALRKVKLMPIALAPQVAAQIKNDPKFNIADLESFIKAELRSQKVLEEVSSSAAALSEITIDEYAFYPTSNVVLFGKTYHAGTIKGVLRIRDAQSNELSNQRIETSVRISLPDQGETANPLEPLYREFARQLGGVLIGTSVQSAIQVSSDHGGAKD